MRFFSRCCWRLFYSLRRSKSCELVSINKVSNESFGDNLRRNSLCRSYFLAYRRKCSDMIPIPATHGRQSSSSSVIGMLPTNMRPEVAVGIRARRCDNSRHRSRAAASDIEPPEAAYRRASLKLTASAARSVFRLFGFRHYFQRDLERAERPLVMSQTATYRYFCPW
jgi:hypothetical protein